jgi:hypothetical protein
MRFTTTTDTFCTIFLARLDVVSFDKFTSLSDKEDSASAPGGPRPSKTYALLTVERPVSMPANDSIELLGGTGEALHWSYDGTKLQILIKTEELDQVQLA